MKNKLYISLVLCFVCTSMYAQEWKLIAEINLKTNVHRASADYYKNIFITDENGNLYKYDSLGVFQIIYSPPKRSKVSLLEGWRGINIFLFYENFQEYVVLDRFLNQTQPIKLPRERVGFARSATFALDNNIWIFDDIEFTLKKFNTRFEKIDIATPLDLVLDASEYDITFMKEYQNQLFIADKNAGILVFDNFGNYKTKLPFEGVSWFGFWNDEIYFIQNEELVRYHLYRYKEERTPLPLKADFVLLYHNKVYLIQGAKMMIYSF